MWYFVLCLEPCDGEDCWELETHELRVFGAARKGAAFRWLARDC